MKHLKLIVFVMAIAVFVLSSSVILAKPQCEDNSTLVTGMCGDRNDTDGNGIPDAGVNVVGHYTSVYAYDSSGAYYWDLGDGRVYTTTGINSIGDLDQATLTQCDYQVTYRADFGNDPYMNSGWIINNINCHGYDDNGSYNYLIVSSDDPRYTGNPNLAEWGTWEYHVLTISGSGNWVAHLVHPQGAVGN